MFVLLFDVLNGCSLKKFKHLLLRKTDFLLTCRKRKIFGKKIWRNALALKSKKGQDIFGEKVVLALLSSAFFLLQNSVLDFF